MSSLPLTYTDLLCGLDLDANGGETTSDLQNLVQDVSHVLLADLGSNPDDPTRGIGLFRFLNGTVADLQTMAKTAEAQLAEDDRIDAISANVSQSGLSAEQYLIAIQIQVDGAVLGLEFAYASSSGLSLTSQALNGVSF
jgi:hypothetical protein